jgi:hypothetical protein
MIRNDASHGDGEANANSQEVAGLKIAQAATLAAEVAVRGHMQGFGVDRQTAMQWIRTALELLSDQDEITNRLANRSS